MNIAEFVKENFSLIYKEEIGGCGISGKELAKFKSIILELDEFKGIENLNILSLPTFRTYYNGKPRPLYIAHSEDEHSVITEKHTDESGYKSNFIIDFNMANGRRELTQINERGMTSCVNVKMNKGNIFSDTVDLYAINVMGYTVKQDEINNLGEGIYFMPTTYTPDTFSPLKEIRIKINPERRQDINVVNPNDGDEMMQRIYKHIDDRLAVLGYCNVPIHYNISLRVSPRSLRQNSVAGEYITVKINKEENNDINNYIFGR